MNNKKCAYWCGNCLRLTIDSTTADTSSAVLHYRAIVVLQHLGSKKRPGYARQVILVLDFVQKGHVVGHQSLQKRLCIGPAVKYEYVKRKCKMCTN